MKDAIRRHLRDFVAVAVLAAVGLVTLWVILQEQRLRIPVLEERPFELKAEFETGQAVVSGQGQVIRVAGIRIGDVQEVELSEGVAVATFAIDREYLPIYSDATILLRPTTGLKDMFFDLDPGTAAAGEVEEGETLPITSTAPDINLDQVLAALDADTRAYLRLALVGAGQGLDGRARDLGRLLGGLGPINEKIAALNGEVADRRAQLRSLVHALNLVTGEVGRAEDDLARLIAAANGALEAVASREPDLSRSLQSLPETLEVAQETLADVGSLADVLGPTANHLRPFAAELPSMSRSLESLATSTTPVLSDQIRPFVRAARPLVPDLAGAARSYSRAAPDLTVIGEQVNRLANMTAYNPRGREEPGVDGRDEGYLYWAAWVTHNGTSVFEAADGNGLYRRFYLTGSCTHLANMITTTPLGPLVHDLDLLFAAGAPCA